MLPNRAQRPPSATPAPAPKAKDALADLQEELEVMRGIGNGAQGPPLDFDDAAVEETMERIDSEMQAARQQGARAQMRAQLDGRDVAAREGYEALAGYLDELRQRSDETGAAVRARDFEQRVESLTADGKAERDTQEWRDQQADPGVGHILRMVDDPTTFEGLLEVQRLDEELAAAAAGKRSRPQSAKPPEKEQPKPRKEAVAPGSHKSTPRARGLLQRGSGAPARTGLAPRGGVPREPVLRAATPVNPPPRLLTPNLPAAPVSPAAPAPPQTLPAPLASQASPPAAVDAEVQAAQELDARAQLRAQLEGRDAARAELAGYLDELRELTDEAGEAVRAHDFEQRAESLAAGGGVDGGTGGGAERTFLTAVDEPPTPRPAAAVAESSEAGGEAGGEADGEADGEGGPASPPMRLRRGAGNVWMSAQDEARLEALLKEPPAEECEGEDRFPDHNPWAVDGTGYRPPTEGVSALLEIEAKLAKLAQAETGVDAAISRAMSVAPSVAPSTVATPRSTSSAVSDALSAVAEGDHLGELKLKRTETEALARVQDRLTQLHSTDHSEPLATADERAQLTELLAVVRFEAGKAVDAEREEIDRALESWDPGSRPGSLAGSLPGSRPGSSLPGSRPMSSTAASRPDLAPAAAASLSASLPSSAASRPNLQPALQLNEWSTAYAQAGSVADSAHAPSYLQAGAPDGVHAPSYPQAGAGASQVPSYAQGAWCSRPASATAAPPKIALERPRTGGLSNPWDVSDT